GGGNYPRRDVALSERRARAPVRVLAKGRPQRQKRHIAREVVGREQVKRRVERSGGQQIDLAGKRRCRKEVRQMRRRGDRPHENSWLVESAGLRNWWIFEEILKRCVSEDASTRVPKPPHH